MKMRIVLTALLIVFLRVTVFAQVQIPQAFNYKAVARDTLGNPLQNTTISIQISVLDGSSGPAEYVERHTITTNEFGQVIFAIGQGQIQSGTFSGITWPKGNKFLKIEMDPQGGTSYINIGTSQLLSVPYALNAFSYKAGEGIRIGHDTIINNYKAGNAIKINNDNIMGDYKAGEGIKISNDTVYSVVHGHGGNNYMTKWFKHDSLGNSLISDDGTDVSVEADMYLSKKIDVTGAAHIMGDAQVDGAFNAMGYSQLNGGFTASTGQVNTFTTGTILGNPTVSGNLSVTGTLSKGSGTFKIDHPLDPENKFLFHSFVESPDMMNIYNGNIITDANGDAEVKLPSYFEALNTDFRYQLTVIGQFAQAIVAEKIKGNQFKIKTDKPNVEVSWQVTGVRNDPFANKNRVVPEVEKSASEKGKYLYPEAFGKSKETGIGYRPPVRK